MRPVGLAGALAACLLCCAAEASPSSNPFDARRLGADAEGAAAASGKTSAATKRGVLCGLTGDLDRLSICVDGGWVSQEVFALHAGARVAWATRMGIKLSTGEVVVIGGVLPRWGASLQKGFVK